jgi:hypothetical protein
MVAPTRVEASVKVSATALVCTRAPAARTVWIVLRACASYDSGAPERTKEMTRVAEGDPAQHRRARREADPVRSEHPMRPECC